jgi:pyridoxal phosphate enzyme (YggS family)
MLSNPQNSASDTPAARLAAVRDRMARAAAAAGRDVRDVTLLAVSKGQDAARIGEAMALGLTEFGENYVAEALAKMRHPATRGAHWHFIGRLQANKTRAVAENFSWVHSVDRLRTAERLSAQRPFHAPPLNVCVQVHVADDPEKGGVAPEAAVALLQAIASLPRLQPRGLMCMLPYEAPPEVQQACFARMAALAAEARASGLPVDTLSMGMSADLEAAIVAGSTMVRVGTALFGPRDT